MLPKHVGCLQWLTAGKHREGWSITAWILLWKNLSGSKSIDFLGIGGCFGYIWVTRMTSQEAIRSKQGNSQFFSSDVFQDSPENAP